VVVLKAKIRLCIFHRSKTFLCSLHPTIDISVIFSLIGFSYPRALYMSAQSIFGGDSGSESEIEQASTLVAIVEHMTHTVTS